MVTIYIDNKPYQVKADKNLLETCLTLGFDVPYFCWHPALGSVGACRQCAVKTFKDENDTKGRIVMSCMEPLREHMRVSVTDAEAADFRTHIIEWLMTNHPHDCAVCDEGGSCHLQDMTVLTGHAHRQYHFKKRTYLNQYLGPFLNHEMNRCIQCYRCVRFYKDYAGGKDLNVFAAHNHVYFGRHEDGVLESEFSGNLAEVCPTGVFTDKTLKRHYTRKWDLTMSPSICQHCSLGCNTTAGERYGSLRQITNRYNGHVNGYFLCDRGRFGYEFVNSPDRIRQPMSRLPQPRVVPKKDMVPHIADLIKNRRVIGIGSPRASVESNFALMTLVGKENFSHGISDTEHKLIDLALRIMREKAVYMPSLKEIEKADAIFILGEDLTNTAPMLDLAVRQAVRQQPMQQVTHVPLWQDAAIRTLLQGQTGPLYIASPTPSKLDELATAIYRNAPEAVARLGFAVANIIHAAAPVVTHLSVAEQALAQQIAEALLTAENPVILSGCSCGSESVLRAVGNIVQAMRFRKKQLGVMFTLPECNSLGLTLLGGHRLDAAFGAVLNGYADTVIMLENDLYRRAEAKRVDQFLKTCTHVILLDHMPHATTEHATLVLPAGTFAESDGTLVNNEGRAQRFYQVYQPTHESQESWRWLMEIGQAADYASMRSWKSWDEVIQAIENTIPDLQGIGNAAPPASFRILGQKIPREPHRYSGRTAMRAQENVSEPKPPDDTDSPLSFTMEGYRGQPPSSLIPFFWSPGWNSVQSVTKYQDEAGGHLRHGEPGIRLLKPVVSYTIPYFLDVPERFEPVDHHLLAIPLYHIFGSDELSVHSPGIAERMPQPYVALHTEVVEKLGLHEGEWLECTIDDEIYRFPIHINNELPRGVAGFPVGLPGMPFLDLPTWTILKQELTWKRQLQTTY